MMGDDDFGFAPPAFDASESLQRLRRELRALGLEERGGVFVHRGLAIAKAVLVDGALQAAVVRRPSRQSPEWQGRALKDGAALRDFVAELKKRLAAWGERDD